MTHETLKNNASVMVLASKALELMAIISLNECEDETMGQFLCHMMIPSFVLRAFSCEFILKALVVESQGNIHHIHKLNNLYHRLDEPTKTEIANSVIAKMKMHNVNYFLTDFLTDLDNITDIFIDWRHFVNCPSSLDKDFLESLFNVLIGYTLTR